MGVWKTNFQHPYFPLFSSHFMKHLIIIAFLFFQTVFSVGQIVNDDLSFFSFSYDKSFLKNNRVETVTIERILQEGRKSNISIYHFDKEGLLDKQTIQNEKGVILCEFYFKPNSHSDLILRIKKDYQYKQVDTLKYYKYYEKNKLIKDSSSELPMSYLYEYNSKGKLIKSVIHSNFGLGNKVKRVTNNKLDSLGRISNSIETVFYNDNDSIGTLFSDRDFIYAANGKLEKEIEKVNSKNSWMANKGSINYVYDSNGNLKQLINASATSYSYTYNEKGLILTKRSRFKIEPDAFDDKGMDMESFDKYTYTFRQ